MSLPNGVEYVTVDGEEHLATRGPQVGDEPVEDGWRAWDPHRSKLGAMLKTGMDTGLKADDSVLYLGAAAGTTVSHVADVAGPTYAIEFAPRPLSDLLSVASDRENLFPIHKDARAPETYAHVVEANVDIIIQDVATQGQARVACENRQFLTDDGQLIMAIKARSEDVTADPETVFETVKEDLRAEYVIEAASRLEPYHDDHLAVVATPR